MSLMIKSVEQSTANMLKAEKARFIQDLYKTGIITKEEYIVLKGEIL